MVTSGCSSWSGSKARVYFSVLTAVFFFVSILAGNTFSEDIDAQGCGLAIHVAALP